MLVNCLLLFPVMHVILLISEYYFVLQRMPIKNVTRKFKLAYSESSKKLLRFNGTSFKNEPSSKYSHKRVYALGSYRNSPFVTGSYYSTNGANLKTEILDYKAGKWIQVKDYPFSNSDR